jgi:hypothetical protein
LTGNLRNRELRHGCILNGKSRHEVRGDSNS